uniref:hypothetical protein n=1 Tax=Stieleria sp. TaxID=2795976 RepID=UPI003562728E
LTIVASLEPVGPKVQVITTPSFPATPGQPITIEPIADSDVALSSTTLSIDGTPVALNALGRGTFIANAPGRFTATAVVTDAEGRTTTITKPIFVRDPSDFAAPVIEVLQLAPPVFTETRDLIVNISDTGLAEYRIELIPKGGGSARLIGQGTTSITQNVEVDPAKFRNGFYTLRVTASDFGGLSSTFNHDIEINSSDKSGALFETATDLSVTLGGITVPITRVHDSLTIAAEDSAFGARWTLPLLDPQLSLDLGADSGDAFAAMTDDARIYLTLPDGQRVGFQFAPAALSSGTVATFAPAWQADSGVDWTLESFGANLRKAGSGYYVVGSGLPYSPSLVSVGDTVFTLVSPSGERFSYAAKTASASFSLVRITAADGSTSLRVTDSGIVAPSGERLTIVRDSDRRISEWVGPAGEQIVYRYDDEGRLAVAIDVSTGDRTFYGYDTNSRLTTISPRATAGQSISYDVDGAVDQIATIQPHLGGTRALVAAPISGMLGSHDDIYSFTITEGELRSSPTGAMTLGIDLIEGFADATAKIMGLTAVTTTGTDSRPINVYTIDRPGTFRVAVTGTVNTSYVLEV